MRKLLPLLSLALLVGCSGNVSKNADPVDITGTVQMAGQPLTGVTLNLQATGDGAPASIPVVNGAFKATVVPGKYTYFFSGSSADFAKIPAAYHAGSLDRQVTISSGTVLTLNLE